MMTIYVSQQGKSVALHVLFRFALEIVSWQLRCQGQRMFVPQWVVIYSFHLFEYATGIRRLCKKIYLREMGLNMCFRLPSDHLLLYCCSFCLSLAV